MTHAPDSAGPTADLASKAPKPYQPPALTALGSIEVLTAGPDSEGSMDSIVGAPGGFTRDSTS